MLSSGNLTQACAPKHEEPFLQSLHMFLYKYLTDSRYPLLVFYKLEYPCVRVQGDGVINTVAGSMWTQILSADKNDYRIIIVSDLNLTQLQFLVM